MNQQVKSTAPLRIETGGRPLMLSRRFLGNLFPENCYEKKELDAYCRGQEFFNYKHDEDGNPMRYRVRQEYFYK